MEEADMVCDQLNNAIGRSIGVKNKGADNTTMAEKVAEEIKKMINYGLHE